MKKIRKDKNVWILFGGSILLCWLFVGEYGIFGSRVDWISQHSVLPDYFRQRFYETGNLFPDMAWNLGGGQNIYNFSYYGLFNPVILFSYLLPFIKMDIYIMVSSVLCYGSSVVLFYIWTDKKQFPPAIRVLVSCMFALAAPMIYHSYNQLMFVNYMPFLCMGLLGTDRYFGQKRAGLLIVGTCGMIFTSYYFSIGGMLTLCIYAFGEYLCPDRLCMRKDRGWLKEFIKKTGGYVGNLIIAVSVSGVLLVPSFCAIMSGRQETVQKEINMQLLTLQSERVLYSAYGIGLTSFALICLIGRVVCSKNGRERWNSVCLLIILYVPVFGYLLNGGLYDKSKVFIPFLPLVCLEIARYNSQCLPPEHSFQNVHRWIRYLMPYVLTILLLCVEKNQGIFDKYRMWIVLDACLMLLLSYRKHFGYPRQLLVSCMILFFYGWGMNWQQGKMLSDEEYAQVQDSELCGAIKNVLDKDDSLYRMDVVGNGTENKNNLNRIMDIRQDITSIYSSSYNACYQEFRKNTFQLNESFRNHMMQSATDNPIFLQFMGVKYLAARQAPAGYHLLEKGEDFNLYENPAVAPVWYVTDQVVGEKEYVELKFPENQTILLQKAVVPDSNEVPRSEPSTNQRTEQHQVRMLECDFSLPLMDENDIQILQNAEGYDIEVKKETCVNVALPDTMESNNLLAVSFDVENENPNSDMYVRINGQTNRLSAENHEYANQNTNFTYMVTIGEEEKIQVKLGPGKYRIDNIKVFTGNLNQQKRSDLYQQTVNTEEQGINGDKISGKVKTGRDGYLITSIPYDRNFVVEIDGKKVDTCKVNTAFLGTKMKAGEHEIVISYTAPGKKAGICLSMAGILLVIFAWVKTLFGRFI
ncbi:MAG: YfhO family protein [Oliverpabstia sp.]